MSIEFSLAFWTLVSMVLTGSMPFAIKYGIVLVMSFLLFELIIWSNRWKHGYEWLLFYELGCYCTASSLGGQTMALYVLNRMITFQGVEKVCCISSLLFAYVAWTFYNKHCIALYLTHVHINKFGFSEQMPCKNI